jgi:heptosyltransferase-2
MQVPGTPVAGRSGPSVLLLRFSSLGDVVLATAAVKALHEDVPQAEIHVATKAPFAEIFSAHPAVANVLALPPGGELRALDAKIREERYDWVVDLHGNLRTRWLRARIRGPRWSVYRKAALRRRVAALLRRPELLPAEHVIDRYLRALEPLGVSPLRRLPEILPRERDGEEPGRILDRAGFGDARDLIALAPGARWPAKAWPEGYWGELLRRIRDQDRLQPILVGGDEDAALCDRIADAAGTPVVKAAGVLSVLGTAALLSRCRLLVANDSAPMHLAVAVGLPVVALFGPTVSGFGFFPLGGRDRVLERELPCRPCSVHGGTRCPEGHHSCLRDIEPEDVLACVERVLG